MKTLDRLIFLKSVELFRDFAVEDLSLIADVAREVELQADQVLFREGEPADRLWLLVDGNVTLYSDKDGGFHLITVLSARDAAGDVALFDGGVHPASGRVEQAGMALAIERDDLMALVRDYPSLAVAFLTQLAQTVRRFQGRIALMEDAMVQMGREAGGR